MAQRNSKEHLLEQASKQLEVTTYLALLGGRDWQIHQVCFRGGVSLPHYCYPEPVRLGGPLQQIVHSPAGLRIPEGCYGNEDAL